MSQTQDLVHLFHILQTSLYLKCVLWINTIIFYELYVRFSFFLRRSWKTLLPVMKWATKICSLASKKLLICSSVNRQAFPS